MSPATHSPTRTHATASGDRPAINRETAGALAALLRIRRPAWDQLTTLERLLDASVTHRDVADLAAGAIRIANDPTAGTPQALLLDLFDHHWRRTATPTITSVTVNASCQVSGHEGYLATNCPGCRIDVINARHATDRAEMVQRAHWMDAERG